MILPGELYSMLGDQLSGLVIMVIWTIYVWVEDTTTYKVATQSLLNVIQLLVSFIRVWHFQQISLCIFWKEKSVLIYPPTYKLFTLN
jgi:hypothetical protein